MLYPKQGGIKDPIQEQAIVFPCPAGVQTSQPFTAPTNRGDILGIQVFTDNTTIIELVKSTITIAANGVNFYENIPLAKFSTLFNNSNNEFDFFAASGSTISVVVNSLAAGSFDVAVNFLFRPPHYK